MRSMFFAICVKFSFVVVYELIAPGRDGDNRGRYGVAGHAFLNKAFLYSSSNDDMTHKSCSAWEGIPLQTHGSLLVPIILGSDKTTVSVATGDNEYYPLYMSIGTVHNKVRRADKGALVLIGFLAIPKGRFFPALWYQVPLDNLNDTAEKSHADSVSFRKFRRKLHHSTLAQILANPRPGMTTPEVVLCFNNHCYRVIYSIGPYIADYPEQALLSCVVQGWCPR